MPPVHRAQLAEINLRGTHNVKERLAMRLIQEAMKKAITHRRLRQSEEIARQAQEQADKASAAARRGMMKRMSTAMDLNKAQRVQDSLEEQLAAKDAEMEAKLAEFEQFKENLAVNIRAQVEKEIKADVKREMNDKFEKKLETQKTKITELRDECKVKMDEIDRLRDKCRAAGISAMAD